MSKYIETTAKVLSIDENGYIIGFECPDCESGFVTTKYAYTGEPENAPAIGDIIMAKVSHITMVDSKITDIELFDETPRPGHMPDIVARARELELLGESTTAPTGRYKVHEVLSDHLYKLEDTTDGSMNIGISDKMLEINTLADEDAFERIAQEHPMADFTLIHHWWDNGKFEHWDLFLNENECTTHFVLEHNPLKETEIKIAQRVPYSEEFWQKGENGETIAPGEPGNPSKEQECQIERLDLGKVAIYESAPQPDNSYLLRAEFFGKTLEGRWSFTSSVQNVWHALKETVKLSEEFPIKIELSGDLAKWEETDDGLLVQGTALSFGVWNGFYWPPDVIMNSPLDDFDNMIIDIEHDNDKPVGAILEKQVAGPDVNVKFLVTDYETAEKIKSGEYKGLSIDASVFADPVRRLVTGVKAYKRLTVCENPACKVCFLGV